MARGSGLGAVLLIGGVLLAVTMLNDREDPKAKHPDTRPPLGVTVVVETAFPKTPAEDCWQIRVRDTLNGKRYTPCVSKYRHRHATMGIDFMWDHGWNDER